MKMKKLSMMVQDGSFADYKFAVLTAEMYKDSQFQYRGEQLDTKNSRFEVDFVERFLETFKTLNDDNTSRTSSIH